MSHHISIALVLAFLSSVAYAQHNYMFFYLSWPGGNCPTVDKCCFPHTFPMKNDFTVQYIARSYSGAICPGKPFSPYAIQPLLNDLNEYWPSFACADDANMQMWKQRWTDDGDCTGLEIEDYFAKGLELRKKANLLDVLARNGITPSHYNNYSTTDVVNAVSTALGVVNSTVLSCGSNKLERLLNVRFCVDITATRFITCPKLPDSTYCPDRVKLELLPDGAVAMGEVENTIEMVASQ